MPDPLFADMYRDTENLTWAPTDQVRQHGRQRTRRTRAAAVLATVVAVGVITTGAVALAGLPGPVPVTPATPSPSVSPTMPAPTSVAPTPVVPPWPVTPDPTTPGRTATSTPADPAVPLAAMLQVADVPSGYRLDNPEYPGDWELAFSAGSCQSPDHPLFRMPVRADRQRHFQGGLDKPLAQRVKRYSTRDAERFMDLVRDRVETCNSDGVTLTVVSSGFAGAESVLIRADYGGGAGPLHILVRQGDLVSEVWQKDLTDPAAARGLGREAADRLCAGTDAC